MHLSKSDVK